MRLVLGKQCPISARLSFLALSFTCFWLLANPRQLSFAVFGRCMQVYVMYCIYLLILFDYKFAQKETAADEF
jgi:Ca2+/Na+ antiporter